MRNFYPLKSLKVKLVFALFFLASISQINAQVSISDPDQNVSGTITFTDSGGTGGNYTNNENQAITLSSTTGGPLIVNFSSFSVEGFGGGGCFDLLSIYDGNSTAGTLLAQYCDDFPPSGFVSSIGTQLHFVFTSDGSVVQSGWIASIYPSPADPTFPNTDGDALDNSADADDDNDGVIDTVELGTCAGSGTSVDWST